MVDVVEWPGVSGMTTTSPPHPRTSERADDRRFGVVAALDQHVGTQRADQLERRVLVEDDNGVDHRQRRQHVTPFRRRSAPAASGL